MQLALQRATTFDPSLLPKAPIDALYVHIPFCFHKCHYCDFYSITRQSPQRMSGFVDLILREAEMWPGFRPKTVFFGGGTPTLLPVEDMRWVVGRLPGRTHLSVAVRRAVATKSASGE